MSTKSMLILCFSLLVSAIFSGCRKGNIHFTPVVVQAVEELYLTETPVPECVSLPDVKLALDVLSDNTVEIKVTGLASHEPVYVIYRSEVKDQGKSLACCEGETADSNGTYRQIEALRLPDAEEEFKYWTVQVVHSRGSACAEFMFSDP